jgi:hypothetical protein
MATATQEAPATRKVARHAAETVPRRGEYRCECGHVLRVFGEGRHQVYFEPGNTALDDPVMNGSCPACERELPGKTRS